VVGVPRKCMPGLGGARITLDAAVQLHTRFDRESRSGSGIPKSPELVHHNASLIDPGFVSRRRVWEWWVCGT